jgi:uncharacterized protein (DUF2225 family)
MNPLYQIHINCKSCSRDFQTSKVRSSFKKPRKVDSDFCVHYNEGQENPEYYVVHICPYCGYASTSSFATALHEAVKELYRKKISTSWVLRDFGGRRTVDDAMFSFKLALYSAQISNENERLIAGILHHIAWLYRYQLDSENELRYLQLTLEAYMNVFEKDESGENNRAKLMYLIGDLHRRLKQYNEAVRWFGKVIQDPSITDAGMIRACREGWMNTREDMIAQRLELPEVLKSEKK